MLRSFTIFFLLEILNCFKSMLRPQPRQVFITSRFINRVEAWLGQWIVHDLNINTKCWFILSKMCLMSLSCSNHQSKFLRKYIWASWSEKVTNRQDWFDIGQEVHVGTSNMQMHLIRFATDDYNCFIILKMQVENKPWMKAQSCLIWNLVNNYSLYF